MERKIGYYKKRAAISKNASDRIPVSIRERFKDIIVEIKPPQWYYHICEELDNNLTPEEKGSPLVCRPILDKTYVVIELV